MTKPLVAAMALLVAVPVVAAEIELGGRTLYVPDNVRIIVTTQVPRS